MNILIIGNLGYVGPIVAEHLHRQGHRIFGLDTAYFAHCLTAHRWPDSVQAQYYSDLRDCPMSTATWYDNLDSVVYLAAISNDPMGNAFAEPTQQINEQSAINVASWAAGRGIKSFVYASSCSVYGCGDDSPRNEQSPVDPLTAYAKSKVAAEHRLFELSRYTPHATRFTCLRFATACGFSPRLRLDLVLNDFVASAMVNGRIDILSDGTPWRPLIHVKDMARAIEWACQRDIGTYLVLNVGCNKMNYRVKDLAISVAMQIPCDLSVNPEAQPDKRSYQVDFSLFEKLAPNHQPKFGLFDSIASLKKGLESIGFNDKNFRQSNLIRLNVLKELQQKGLLTPDLRWA